MKEISKITDLLPDYKNFNKHSQFGMSLLEKSMRQHGFMEAGVISEDGVIISGNARQETAVNIGLEDVQIIETDGKRAIYLKANGVKSGTKEFHELAMKLNATAKANIVLDVDLIEVELEDVKLEEWGLESNKAVEAEEDDYEYPENMKVDVVLGDLIEIGEHRVICGSSTEVDTWEKLMGEELGDLVVTDPPYNVDYTGKTKDALKIDNDNKSDGDFYQFLYDFYTAQNAYIKPGGGWYVWHADSEGANFRKAMIESGILLKQCLIWVKSSMVMGRQDYHWKHEPCLYGWKEGAAHNWYTDRKQTTVLEFDRPNRNAEHPTMKPVTLISYQIGNSSKKGDIVCDGFLGSGTTMVAAHQLNRKCYGMEIDPRYCQVIIDRMRKLDDSIEIKINGEIYEG